MKRWLPVLGLWLLVGGLLTLWAVLGSPETAAAPLARTPDESALESAVLAADRDVKTDADALEAARLIDAAIRAKPDRAELLARLLSRLENRALAFRITLLVAQQVTTSGPVRSALLDSLERGSNHAREVTAYAFYGVRGDKEAAVALAHGYQDEGAGDRARAAQGFALVNMLPDLPDGDREAVRATARKIARDAQADAALRSESVGLLDLGGADREIAREILRDDTSRAVALNAARVLLRAGEDQRTVEAHLMRFAADGPTDDLTARSLGEMLRGGDMKQ
jgi:hypothetical protein